MIKHYHFPIIICLFLNAFVAAQEIKQFGLEDFDLKGNVKTCQVITDYGREIFEFDMLGRLVTVTTQYNEEDKDITTYTFDKEELVEKRVESYKDNVLDLASSMAYIYKIDSTENKIVTEQIISYDKEFVEVQEYQFNEEGQLVKIVVSHENAVDEIKIEHSAYKNEITKTYFENGVVQKSIRESVKKDKKMGNLDLVLNKSYLDGEPNKAVETIRDKDGKLISEEVFYYDAKTKEFASQEKHIFEYDSEGILTKETLKKGNAIVDKNYIFQFDDNEERNWVKKIITPANTYTTRKIDYYPKIVAGVEIPEE